MKPLAIKRLQCILHKPKETFKMQRDVGIADQQKARKQGRDDSICSSVYNLTLHIRERGSVLYLGMATEILNLP